ncbi:MAG: RidA family protein [Firmicutes bacterium]|nr:RidA family protein [Bacillota bacterium]
MLIENISTNEHRATTVVAAKKIDMGNFYMIYLTGKQPRKDKATNACLSNDITEQTHQVFQDIESVLKKGGASLDDVIEAVIYLTDMKNFSIVSPIRDMYFAKAKPVSTMVEVSRMTREGTLIEVKVNALVKK